MRVMHIITGLGAGGAENQLRLLVSRTRHDAEVITLTNPGSVAAAIQAEGTPVQNAGMWGNRDVRALWALRARIRDYRPHVVHVHLFRACVYGRIAARLASVPNVVTTEHSLGDGYIEGRATTRGNRFLYLLTDRLSDVTVAVSNTVRERLVDWGVPPNKIVVIPNGLDFEALRFDSEVRGEARREFGFPHNAVVIGALGRLDAVKGFDILLEASRPLLAQGCRLLIVGDGPERAKLVEQASAYGLASSVVFAGERRDVPRLLAAMDLMVAPSFSETFGLAVIEGLGAGLPVIYTECPALEQIANRGGANARRVSGGDRRSLLQAMQATIASPPERKAPPSVVERFGIAACSAATDRLYESLSTN